MVFLSIPYMLGEDLDAVLFLGDYIYEYPAGGKAVRIPSGGWVLTLDDYRARYALSDSSRTLLGATQEQWLDQSLQQASPGWNLIGQQTLFGQRDFKAGTGQSFWNDGWDGYPGARQRLTASLIKHKVANPTILGGDVHENWVGHIKADYNDANSANVGVEFCGTSISSRGGGNARRDERLTKNPHFIFADGDRSGYGVVEITPQRLTTTLRVVDDVTQKETRIETLAQFMVEAGRPVVHRTA